MEHPFFCYKCGNLVDKNKSYALQEGDMVINFCNSCFRGIEEKDYQFWIDKTKLAISLLAKTLS